MIGPDAPGAVDAAYASTEGISAEEREQILRQIDALTPQGVVADESRIRAYAPRRHGAIVPIAVNIFILAVLVCAGLLIARALNFQEQSIASGEGTIQSTESKLIAALRQESDQKLRDKDRAILDAQQKITVLATQEQQLRDQSDAQLKARAQELEDGMQKKLAAERARLQASGLAAAALEQNLRRFEAAQRQAAAEELGRARAQAQAELAAQTGSLEEQASQAQKELDAARQDRIRLQGDYALKESSLLQQLSQAREAAAAQQSAATGALEQLRAQQSAATGALDQLRAQRDKVQLVLDQILASHATESAVREEASAAAASNEEEDLQNADGLLRRGNTLYKAGSDSEALQSYRQGIALLVKDDAMAAMLTNDVMGIGYRTIGGADLAELARLRADEKRRQAIVAAIGALPGRGQEEATASAADTSSLSELLQAKILVRKVLDSEPARTQYPGLSAELDRYYAALEEQSAADATAATLRELTALFSTFATPPVAQPSAEPQNALSPDEQALLGRLQELLIAAPPAGAR